MITIKHVMVNMSSVLIEYMRVHAKPHQLRHSITILKFHAYTQVYESLYVLLGQTKGIQNSIAHCMR